MSFSKNYGQRKMVVGIGLVAFIRLQDMAKNNGMAARCLHIGECMNSASGQFPMGLSLTTYVTFRIALIQITCKQLRNLKMYRNATTKAVIQERGFTDGYVGIHR